MLTDDCKFLNEIDELTSKIYSDKKEYYLTYKEIAELRGLPASTVRERFLQAKKLLKNKKCAWMNGLSPRAVHTLEDRYSNFKELYDEVMVKDVDLETFDGVGHKVALEVRRWLKRKNAIGQTRCS